MKRKSLFKNRTQMVVYIILYILCISLFVVIGKTNYQVGKPTEAEEFSSIYSSVSLDNAYTFCNANKVLEIIDGRSGVILMGFPSNKWMNSYAKILEEVRKELGVNEIYYYDFLQDREENNGTYETIVKRLSAYAPVSDEGMQDIAAPTVLIVKNGDIIAYFDDTAIIKGSVTPNDYYTENQIGLTYQMFKTALEEYIK